MPSRPLCVAVITAALTLVGCGGDDDDTTATTDSVTDVSLVPASPPASVPAVSVPAELPTELVVTELRAGAGEGAVEGQYVFVNYVGVRTANGEQFDTNFGEAPYPVQLGAGGVIDGWDQGLVGAKTGEKLQLDIPSELAYGDTPRGDIIQAGDALTFVIEVRSVVPGPPTEADIPTSAEPVTEQTADDVRPGTGDALALGDTALFHVVFARHDDGTVLSSSWDQQQPVPLTIKADELPPGLADLLVGMQVGGRRILLTPADADNGTDGDLVLVLDLLAIG